MTEPVTLTGIPLLLSMLAPGYQAQEQDDEFEPDEPDDLFRASVVVNPTLPERPDLYECGSAKASNTAAALYRLLFLLQPKEADFSDMYKSEFLRFGSTDGRFLVTAEFFKYELGLYFYCPKACLSGHRRGVIAGHPGADNGTRCDDPEGQQFFELATRAMESKWMVYPGNDFEV